MKTLSLNVVVVVGKWDVAIRTKLWEKARGPPTRRA